MMSKKFRKTHGLVVAIAALGGALALVDCGGKLPGAAPGGNNGSPGGLPGLSQIPGGSCPADIANASAIYSANFGLDAALEGKVKAALAAGANLQGIAADLETQVATACGNLAKDLGATDIEPKDKGPGKRAEAACNAAAKALGEIKAKAKGSLKVEVKAPKCSASVKAMADCAGKCDATVKPGSVKATCEGGEISGKCNAECKGTCTVQAGAKCEGTCGGSCSGTCEGTIDGKCDGKCDGKESKGKPCAGTCDGKCAGKANAACSGTCKGECSASCKMETKGKCAGECSGGCSVDFEAPKCSGEVKPPEMSAECKANCDAEVNAKVECEPAHVTVKLEGAADAAAGTKLKTALEKDLPALLKVTMGMKGRVEKAVGNVKVALEGGEAAVKGGGTGALKVASCFASSLKAQAEASVQINVSIKASASASAEAGTK